ncbi:MAG: hypothetical protein ACE5HR_07265 [bacterium]
MWSIQKKRYLQVFLISLVISIALGLIVTYFTLNIHPLEYPKPPTRDVAYWGFPFAWLKQSIYDWPGPKNEIIWSGFALDTLFWTLVLFIPITILYVLVMSSFLKKQRCPVCGAKSIEKNPKQWITAPGTGRLRTPITFTSRYKYRCRKCQHEWED